MPECCENLHMPARRAGLVSHMVPGTAVKGDKGSPHPPTYERCLDRMEGQGSLGQADNKERSRPVAPV